VVGQFSLDPVKVADNEVTAPEDQAAFKPIKTPRAYQRFNLDGLVRYCLRNPDKQWQAYVQVFRKGVVELVDGVILQVASPDRLLHARGIEDRILSAGSRFLQGLTEHGLHPPVYFAVSLLDVEGFAMPREGYDLERAKATPVTKPNLILPEVGIEAFSQPLDIVLRPVFDMIAQAAGWPGSPNYDEAGRWAGAEDSSS
jgi:hypothetical protein